MNQAAERLGYVVLGVSDLDEAVRFYEQIGHLVVYERSSNVAMLGGGTDHHWLRLEQVDGKPGMIRTGFQLAASESLHAVADRLTARGFSHVEFGDLDGDGIDQGIRFTDPDGVQIDVFNEMLCRGANPRLDLVRMTDMLHAVWYSADPIAAHRFYSEVLGFRASDWIKRNAVFMRAANNFHHSLGIFKAPADRVGQLDHFCINVESIDDVMRARNTATRRGATLQRDVLRHAASGSISVYIDDPFTGKSFEFCTEHEVVGPDHRPRLLEGSVLTRDVWQASSPAERAEEKGLASIANRLV